MASNQKPKEEPTAPNLPRGLLDKSGTPTSKTARLPSVRQARDLTLGGAQRKSFKPNIPVRPRDKPTVTGPVEDKLITKEKKARRDRSDRPDKHGKGRGKGAHSSQSTTIQSQSIFEQGPTERTIKRESIYSGGGSGEKISSSRGSSSSKIKGGRITKAETQDILDQLLRDDFVDDGDDDIVDVTNQPVALPLLDPAKYEEVIKSEVKPIYEKTDQIHDSAFTAPIVDHEEESLKLVLVQLPDYLPGLQSEDKPKPSTTSEKPTVTPTTTEGLADQLSSKCKLSDLSEGKIGKIQIMKSGRARLALGDIIFDLNRGAPCGFLQELVSVETNDDSGNIACLGPIKDKLVVVPNIENLLEL